MSDQLQTEVRLYRSLQAVKPIGKEPTLRTSSELAERHSEIERLVGARPCEGLAAWSLFADDTRGCYAPGLSAVDPLDAQEFQRLDEMQPFASVDDLMVGADVNPGTLLPIGVDDGGAFVVVNPPTSANDPRVCHVDWIAQFFAVSRPGEPMVDSREELPSLVDYIEALVKAHTEGRFEHTEHRSLRTGLGPEKSSFPWPS